MKNPKEDTSMCVSVFILQDKMIFLLFPIDELCWLCVFICLIPDYIYFISTYIIWFRFCTVCDRCHVIRVISLRGRSKGIGWLSSYYSSHSIEVGDILLYFSPLICSSHQFCVCVFSPSIMQVVKHETLTRCRAIVGPSSTTLSQH